MKTEKHIHFVGIGGIGMSGLAFLLLERGVGVSGSDIKENSLTAKLREKGAKIFLGHRRENLGEPDAVVYSSCIAEENPERSEALRRGLKTFARGEFLSHLFHEKKTRIAISGSHGKTTTTALIAEFLVTAGLDPSFLIGGVSRNLGVNAKEGKGDTFVTEADESDGSFLLLSPQYALVTNVDAEHLDYYKTFEKSCQAYLSFFNRTGPAGSVFLCAECPNSMKLLEKISHPHPVTYGLSRTAEYFPQGVLRENGQTHFDCVGGGKRLGRFRMTLSGRHNLLNAVGAIALGNELGIPVSAVQSALASFQGVERRLETTDFPALSIVEDYAHHPTEIEATLRAIREGAERRRIVCLFQPHRYTRTQQHAKSFGSCFGSVDLLILTDIYPAGERPIPGVGTDLIWKEVREAEKEKPVFLIPREMVTETLLEKLRPGDILVVMGAGDIGELAEEMRQICLKGRLPWINKVYETI